MWTSQSYLGTSLRLVLTIRSSESIRFFRCWTFCHCLLQMGTEKDDRVYEDLTDVNKIQSVLEDYLSDYNAAFSKETKLVFFQDAIEHVSR